MKMLKSGKRSGLPHVNMIEIKGHFGTELTRNRMSVMYNENREKELKRKTANCIIDIGIIERHGNRQCRGSMTHGTIS